ncbi:hypothetical protein [Candidatus Regiella endosymbiont of Tuberolachnus salignus]|uniref:hypothetical protein n=1 Tax=Candidatus Regiella endosymbiont of Tuberolachnus salignus TaxID=3077956 RepID=UPI0030D521A7
MKNDINNTLLSFPVLIDTEKKLQEIFDDQQKNINFFKKIVDIFRSIFTGKKRNEKLSTIFSMLTSKKISDNQGRDQLFSFLYLVKNSTEDKKKNYTFMISDDNRVDLIYDNLILNYFYIDCTQVNLIGSLLNSDGSIRTSHIQKFIIKYLSIIQTHQDYGKK